MSEDAAVYGIIGHPLGHSLSPLMHNAAFKELKVNAIYKAIPLSENELHDFFKALRQPSSPIFGLNVTVPYKEKVVPLMDNLSPFAEKAMAVNTIEITPDRKLIGHNTDGPGFLAHWTELKISTAEKRVAILGAGGSTRAIITALSLIPERPQWIKLYNRTTARAQALIKDLKQRIDIEFVEPVMSIDDLNIELADILINTTSVGMKDDDSLIDESLLHRDMFVYDLIYNPKETLLLRLARKHGAQTANGLGMLYYQGVLAFQHWADAQISEKVKNRMRESLERGIKYE